MSAVDDIDLGDVYAESRLRLSALVLDLDDDPATIPVPACPGWSVHDVIAHLVAVVEDVMAGRLAGPPSDDQTAVQVARRRGQATGAVLDEWASSAPSFEELIRAVRVWPAAMDVLSHEQDVRGAVGQPGARECPGVRVGARRLVGMLDTVTFHLDGEPGPSGSGPALRTSSFEAFRLRLGRRSRAQVTAMEWSGDPSPALDGLFIFGPSPADILE